jgi:hypothetical protein
MDRREHKQTLDGYLVKLQIAVVKQLLAKVEKGEDLRAAIDFLRLNRRSVTEVDVIGSTKDASSYLDDLISQIDDEGNYRR